MKRVNIIKAIKAINILKKGLDEKDKKEILKAYDFIEKDASFSWDGIDDLYENWDKLTSEANDFLMED